MGVTGRPVGPGGDLALWLTVPRAESQLGGLLQTRAPAIHPGQQTNKKHLFLHGIFISGIQ